MTETCDFASGRSHSAFPLLRMRVSSRPSRWANMIGAGINSGVSSQAKPNIKPWSPAPCSARSLSLGLLRIHALGDVVRLIGDDGVNENLLGVKNVVIVDVTDLAHGIAHDLIDRNDVFQMLALRQIGDRDLAADDDDVALGVGLAGDAALAILPQAGVEDGVGNGVANFIRMAFAHGFGSKNETSKHGAKDTRLERLETFGFEPSRIDQTDHIDQS